MGAHDLQPPKIMNTYLSLISQHELPLPPGTTYFLVRFNRSFDLASRLTGWYRIRMAPGEQNRPDSVGVGLIFPRSFELLGTSPSILPWTVCSRSGSRLGLTMVDTS